MRERWRVGEGVMECDDDGSSSPGMFSLTTLLFQLVSGVGLLTLAVTIIDTLTLYILPARHMYRQYVYDESPNIKKLE